MGKVNEEREKVKQRIEDVLSENFDEETVNCLLNYFKGFIDSTNFLDLKNLTKYQEFIKEYDAKMIDLGFHFNEENPDTMLYFLGTELFSVIQSYLIKSVEQIGIAGLTGHPSVEVLDYITAFLKLITIFANKDILEAKIFNELTEEQKMEIMGKIQAQIDIMKEQQLNVSPKGVDPDWYNKLKEIPPEWGEMTKEQ